MAIIIAVKMSLIEDSQREEVKNIFRPNGDARLTSNSLTGENVNFADYNPTFNGPEHQVFPIELRDDD